MKGNATQKNRSHSLSAIDSFIYIYPITSLQLYVTSYWAKNDQSLDHLEARFLQSKEPVKSPATRICCPSIDASQHIQKVPGLTPQRLFTQHLPVIVQVSRHYIACRGIIFSKMSLHSVRYYLWSRPCDHRVPDRPIFARPRWHFSVVRSRPHKVRF